MAHYKVAQATRAIISLGCHVKYAYTERAGQTIASRVTITEWLDSSFENYSSSSSRKVPQEFEMEPETNTSCSLQLAP